MVSWVRLGKQSRSFLCKQNWCRNLVTLSVKFCLTSYMALKFFTATSTLTLYFGTSPKGKDEEETDRQTGRQTECGSMRAVSRIRFNMHVEGPFTLSVSVYSAIMLAILFSWKTLELLQNRVTIHFCVTPLFSLRTELLALLQSWCWRWCKWALKLQYSQGVGAIQICSNFDGTVEKCPQLSVALCLW